jgi:hypothetical protein
MRCDGGSLPDGEIICPIVRAVTARMPKKAEPRELSGYADRFLRNL